MRHGKVKIEYRSVRRARLLGEPKIDTTTGIDFLCSLHIEIGDGYLPCSLLCEHPQGLADNRKVLDFVPTTVTKHQDRGCCLFIN